MNHSLAKDLDHLEDGEARQHEAQGRHLRTKHGGCEGRHQWHLY